jgi:hypothetical protein
LIWNNFSLPEENHAQQSTSTSNQPSTRHSPQQKLTSHLQRLTVDHSQQSTSTSNQPSTRHSPQQKSTSHPPNQRLTDHSQQSTGTSNQPSTSHSPQQKYRKQRSERVWRTKE